MVKIEINRDESINMCKEILKKYNITFDNDEIIKESREPARVFVRSLIALILRAKGHSFTDIGIVLNRNHSSVIYMLKYGDKKGSINLRQRYVQTRESIIKGIRNGEF